MPTRKTRKLRGRKTAGWGARKKHRGKGSKGGKGMAGTGKRADTKKTWVLAKIGNKYYGKKGFHSLKKRQKTINLDQVQEKLSLFLEKKIANKDAQGNISVDLTKSSFHKLLGRGNIDKKMAIKVISYSKKAKEKIEKIGGTITGKEVQAKKEIKEENKETKQEE